MQLLKNKKSLAIIIVSMIASNAFTYNYLNKKNNSGLDITNSSDCDNNYKVARSAGYDYIKPILFVDDKNEAENLNSIKQNINGIIENYKKIGVLNSASVYIKEFKNNGWTAVNADEKFLPGSLLKVPELIACLKLNELKPGSLNRIIYYDYARNLHRHTNFNSKVIQVGQKYTIRELLNHMIKYSDNQATCLINENIDLKIFGKVFTDLGLPIPDWTSSSYLISAKEYSLFMRTLYSATYLNRENSEIATKLLSQCDFNQGLIAGLPKGTKAAHKFGEADSVSGQQLSESANVYLNDSAYLLTVTTSGKDYKQLPQIIKDISANVYQSMKTNVITSN